jgi:hypothetical protein
MGTLSAGGGSAGGVHAKTLEHKNVKINKKSQKLNFGLKETRRKIKKMSTFFREFFIKNISLK